MDTLATAFHDDPMLRILEPSASKRARVATWFFGSVVEFALRWGQVWANHDVSAVGIWVPPGPGMTTLRMMRVGFVRTPINVGLRGTMRLLAATSALDQLHRAVGGPHWYVPAIGTRPENAGRGYGGALLAVGIQFADAAGLPCYLEATSNHSRDMAARRGFEVTGTSTVRGFTFSGMVRPASPTSTSSG